MECLSPYALPNEADDARRYVYNRLDRERDISSMSNVCLLLDEANIFVQECGQLISKSAWTVPYASMKL